MTFRLVYLCRENEARDNDELASYRYRRFVHAPNERRESISTRKSRDNSEMGFPLESARNIHCWDNQSSRGYREPRRNPSRRHESRYNYDESQWKARPYGGDNRGRKRNKHASYYGFQKEKENNDYT